MFFRYNLFGIIWGLTILLLTLTPGPSMPYTDIWSLLRFDNFAHLMVFAIFVFLLIVGFRKQYTYKKIRIFHIRAALFTGIGYGILIELSQGLIPGRMVEWIDLIFNFAGCLGGLGIYYLIYRFV